jgi:hypothetical protein
MIKIDKKIKKQFFQVLGKHLGRRINVEAFDEPPPYLTLLVRWE